MNLRPAFLIFTLAIAPTLVAGKVVTDRKSRKATLQKIDKTLNVDPAVAISVCVGSSNVSVRGWDKPELLVRSIDGSDIQVKRSDRGDPSQPAMKVDVSVFDKSDEPKPNRGCQATGDLELSVPRNATVQVQSSDGNISMSDVATALAGTQDGEVSLERISKSVEVATIAGEIYLRESHGRMDLTTVSGNIEVTDASPMDASESIEITTVSGDIGLTQVTHSQVNVRTVNGNLMLTGPLAHGGHYGINTMSGDITFALPKDASFQLDAKISSHGDVISDFPLTLTSQSVSMAKPVKPTTEVVAVAPAKPVTSVPAPPPVPEEGSKNGSTNADVDVPPKKMIKVETVNISPHTLRRIHAVCGSGDAAISVASFSGTLHLQKN